MKVRFAICSVGYDYGYVSEFIDRLLLDLSKYVDSLVIKSLDIEELVVGLIFVGADRASEPVFKPKRIKYDKQHIYKDIWDKKQTVNNLLICETQIDLNILLNLPSDKDKGSYVVENICSLLNDVSVYTTKKSFDINLVMVCNSMRSFLINRF